MVTPIITESDLRMYVESALYDVRGQIPAGIVVTVETKAPGMVRVMLSDPVHAAWWRRALFAMARWLQQLAWPDNRRSR